MIMFIAWSGTYCRFHVKMFLKLVNLQLQYKQLFMLILCYVEMMLSWMKLSRAALVIMINFQGYLPLKELLKDLW